MKKPNFPEPIQNVLRDNDLRSRYMLNLSLWANLLVAAFKLLFGIAVQSFWLGAVGVFYGVLALKNLIQRRKEDEPILAAARTLSFAAALMSILALQTAMITEFGGGADFARTMNTIAGAVISGLLIALSLMMLIKSGGIKICLKRDAH